MKVGGEGGGRPSAPPRFPPLKPAAQMLTNINNQSEYHWGFSPRILNSFSPTLTSKLSQNFVLFLLLRSLENSSDSKSMRVTSPSTC